MHEDILARAGRRRWRVALVCVAALLLALLLWWLLRELAPGMAGSDTGELLGGLGGGVESAAEEQPSSNGANAAGTPEASTNAPAPQTKVNIPQIAVAPEATSTPPRPSPGSSRGQTGSGGVGDEFGRRLAAAGARTGDVQLSLMWNNINDIDLHCVDPNGEEVCWRHRRSASGGELDVDRNAGPPWTPKPVENIYWPPGRAPAGTYRVFVNHYDSHCPLDPTPYSVRVTVGGNTRYFPGSVRRSEPMRLVYEFTIAGAR